MGNPGKQDLNIYDLKKELVSDLDQFLLEEKDEDGLNEAQLAMARQKALAELDKLIKQDLSQQQLLSSIQDLKKKTVKATPANEIIPNDQVLKKSSHVLDLRTKKTSTEPAAIKAKKITEFSDKLQFNQVHTKKTKLASVNFSNLTFPKVNKIKAKPFTFSWSQFKLSNLFSQAVLTALVSIIVLLPIHGFYFYSKIKQDKTKIFSLSKSGLFSLQSGVLSAAENSLPSAQPDFQQALTDFQQAQAILNNYQSWLLNLGGQLPVVGKSLSAGRNLLAVASNVSEAATILSDKVEENAKITDYLIFADKQIGETLPYLEKASADLKKVPINTLPPELQPYFSGLQKDLPPTIANLKSLKEIFSLFGQILGHEEEKRYLILFQNNNELRATGGFIGSIAIVDVYKGQITNLEIPKGGTYDLSAGQKGKVKAPQPLSLVNPTFNIWDANWWPDFPNSAKKITNFYEQAGGSTIDGVISINASVLQELLAIFGPIEMPEYGVTVSSENVFSVLQEQVELKYDRNANTPKAIIADLVPKVLGKLLSFTEKQKEIVALFAKLLDQKDIQMYNKNTDLQKQISSFGWSGEVFTTDRDYLMLVNTNIAGGKTDNDIKQQIEHQAEIQANGDIINTVKITRTNQGLENNIMDGWWGNTTYLRLYVPLGSQFIEASGFDTVPVQYFHDLSQDYKIDPDINAEENKMIDSASKTEVYQSLDKTVLANWQTLKAGETKTVIIKYKLPFALKLDDPLVNDWRKILLRKKTQLDHYSILAQSQSGNHNTTFNSNVILPEGIKVVWKNSSQPDDLRVSNNYVNFSQALDDDRYFGFILVH